MNFLVGLRSPLYVFPHLRDALHTITRINSCIKQNSHVYSFRLVLCSVNCFSRLFVSSSLNWYASVFCRCADSFLTKASPSLPVKLPPTILFRLMRPPLLDSMRSTFFYSCFTRTQAIDRAYVPPLVAPQPPRMRLCGAHALF